MKQDYLQIIGFSKKTNPEKPDVEQISFKMFGPQARLKRRFSAILKERSLGMREVLIEFIQKYVEADGNLGTISLDPNNIRTKVLSLLGFPQENSGKHASPPKETLAERCHTNVRTIMEHASPELRELITDSLDILAEALLKEYRNNGGKRMPAPEAEAESDNNRQARGVIQSACPPSRKANAGKSRGHREQFRKSG